MPESKRPLSSRERIIEEAEHLIHLCGYHCTSLEDIAARCRMTKANLLHHFRSKEDLGLAVLDHKIEAYRRGMLVPILAEGSDPVRAVLGLFASAEAFYRGNGCRAGCFIANIALEMSDYSPRFREKASSFFAEWTSKLEEMLTRGDCAGSPARRRALAEAILSLYEGAVLLARARRDPEVFGRIGSVAAELARPISYKTATRRKSHGTQTQGRLRLLT